jgi:hypothetical protein
MVTIKIYLIPLKSPARPDRARTRFEKGRDFTLDTAGKEGACPENSTEIQESAPDQYFPALWQRISGFERLQAEIVQSSVMACNPARAG